MNWRRALLSVALIGGCFWCLVVVQQVHREERNSPDTGQPYCRSDVPAVIHVQLEDSHFSQPKQLALAGSSHKRGG